ncbi:DUF6044 family protein [Butyrivibrio sp. M55]|uniref:DUF6044 family protein n=1 Tax=Butyrivibrio sp. M55 TaxID=1855323 RepID=UPI0008EC5658|nr:DUF6044 family protein [Butyrivibrio sp. M55]SFU61012.1 hypothetical protein SAMN05216540_104265 [Butyrivibrio sp. M55]
MKLLKRRFVIFAVLLFILIISVFYCAIGENSYIGVHDNMDLFIAQFAMLRNTGTFFSHGVSAPFLGGVSRDVLPGEASLYTVLYMIFSPFTAYIVGYVLKLGIAVFSCVLLFVDCTILSGEKIDSFFERARFCLKEEYASELNLAVGAGFLYGVLNLFPAFGISFASIPLIVYLLRRIYLTEKSDDPKRVRKMAEYVVLIFCYPFVSYFSYFGFFILGYLFIGIIWMWIRDKKPSFGLIAGLVALSVGFVVFEYRLFGMMLFSDVITIRDTMVQSFVPASEVPGLILDVFVNGMMHAEDCHKYFVMPVCLLYLIFLNGRFVYKKNFRGIFTDVYNLCALILVFNAVVYGIYFIREVNDVFATVVPPLKGFQFNRTVFFSPFIWCAMLFIIAYRMSKKEILKGVLSYVVIAMAVVIVIITPTRYNDLRGTLYHVVKENIQGNKLDDLNYREFYSEELFSDVKKGIGYKEGEWSVAYGMHPAILEYNGIATLDGYLGFYPQSYKEEFRKVIAPALSKNPSSAAYFDEWGARCYLYSGTDATIVMATKSMYGVTDNNIYIDAGELKKLGCKYLFSRIDIANAREEGLTPIGEYSGYNSPYNIYVYGLE